MSCEEYHGPHRTRAGNPKGPPLPRDRRYARPDSECAGQPAVERASASALRIRPLPAPKPPAAPFHSDCGNVVGTTQHFFQRPPRGFQRVAGGRQQRRWLGGAQGHVELAEGIDEPLTPRLDIGLLPRPAAEETFHTARRAQAAEGGELST